MPSRRQLLAALAAAPFCKPAISVPAAANPTFSPSGPDAELYGAAEGFPARHPVEDVKNRVGAFSHFDSLHPCRPIQAASETWGFRRSRADIRYTFEGAQFSIEDYVARNPVTGLLIAKDGEILFEHYQYGRTDRDRLISRSMAKSLVAMLCGIAVADGAIRSIDETAETYVPEFKGTEYGRTPIRSLLNMSSGVYFGEEEDNGRDLERLWLDLMGGYVPFYAERAKGTVGGIVQFNRRIAPPGTRFHYSSIEVDIVAMVIRAAVGKPVSHYLQEKLWQPLGTEANASWLVDAQGYELAHGFFNAVLRDYARLGRLLANDGAREGRQVIPAKWVVEATTVRESDQYLAPGKANSIFGYGYFMWLLPWGRRQFALFGDYGQRLCVDPVSKLVMVHTAVDQKPEIWSLWRSLTQQFGQG